MKYKIGKKTYQEQDILEVRKGYRTQSDMRIEGKQRVNTQTTEYTSTHAYKGEDATRPQVISPEVSSGNQIQTSRSEFENVRSSFVGNVQTRSGKEETARQRVENYTGQYTSTHIYKGEDATRPQVVSPEVSSGNRIQTSGFEVENIKPSLGENVQTGSEMESIAVLRAMEFSRPYNTSEIITDSTTQTRTLLKVELEKYKGKEISRQSLINRIKGNVENVVVTAEAQSNGDDLGTKAVAGTVNAGATGTALFKGGQIATEGIEYLGKGVWDISSVVGKTTVAITRTHNILHDAGYSYLSKESLEVLKKQAKQTGLTKNQFVQKINKHIKGTKKRVQNVIKITKGSINGVINGVAIVSSTYSINELSKEHIKYLLKNGSKNIGRIVTRGTLKGTGYVKENLLPTTWKVTGTGVRIGAGILANSDDLGTQAVGNSINIGQIGVKTGVEAIKAGKAGIKTAVHNGVVTSKKAWYRMSYIKQKGLNAAWKRTREKALNKLIAESKSIMSALMAHVRFLSKKAIIPLLLICVVVVAMTGAIETPLTAIASVFGGVFGTKEGNEYDIREYISARVPDLKEEMLDNISTQMQSSRNRYDIVRFKANTGSTAATVIGDAGEKIGDFRITAYCSCEICCGQWSGGPTASGVMPQAGRTIAVDRTQIPLGTKVVINNHTYIAEDTGSAINQNCIDIYMNSHQEALNWGVQYLPVYYASDNPTSTTSQIVTSGMPTNDQITSMIQPIFNAVILMDYDLEPTEAEASQLLQEIFNNLFTLTQETSREECGQDISTGEGTPVTHSCGKIHALGSCPNPVRGTHTTFTCDTCCYKYCPGHEKTNTYTIYKKNLNQWKEQHPEYRVVSVENIEDNDDDVNNDKIKIHVKWTEYDSGCRDACNGYSYCGGHSVLTYTLNMEGVYRLVDKYFTDPINQLSNIQNRTDEQEEELQNLKDYYEICMEYISQVSEEYGFGGGSMSMEDLSGVNFVNGSRPAGQQVIDLALTQVGQTGGQPYWSWYGFGGRVEWCACFVNWCMAHANVSSYPTKQQTGNNAYCQSVANWFQSHSRWGDRSYTDLVAGDTIFFDWEGDGHTDHIGLVIGRDDTTVYTVEGNNGDAVRCSQYPIGSSVIYGYGLMNY